MEFEHGEEEILKPECLAIAGKKRCENIQLVPLGKWEFPIPNRCG